MAHKKRRRRHTSGLGRKKAHGRGPICVTVRKGTKKSSAHTKCFATSKAAHLFLMRAVSGKAGHRVKSALIYKRGRAARAAR
jgi:hypothetical protein